MPLAAGADGAADRPNAGAPALETHAAAQGLASAQAGATTAKKQQVHMPASATQAPYIAGGAALSWGCCNITILTDKYCGTARLDQMPGHTRGQAGSSGRAVGRAGALEALGAAADANPKAGAAAGAGAPNAPLAAGDAAPNAGAGVDAPASGPIWLCTLWARHGSHVHDQQARCQ